MAGRQRTSRPSTPAAQLSIQELHQLVLKVIAVAALREGGGAPDGSRIAAVLDRLLLKINNVLADLETTVPLAVKKTATGATEVGFTEHGFEIVKAYDALVSLCGAQRKAFRADLRRRSEGKHYDRKDLAAGIVAALRSLVRVTAKGADDASKMAEAQFSIGTKPSDLAGKIMSQFHLPQARMCQMLKSMLSDAHQTRFEQQRGPEAVVREFLTCLQVPKESVVPWSREIMKARLPGGDLHATLPELTSPLKLGRGGGRPLPRRRATYSLSEAVPGWSPTIVFPVPADAASGRSPPAPQVDLSEQPERG